MTDFRWLIEAPGPRYLAVQRLSMSDNFEWTSDHDRALALRSEDQADALMMAVRQMDRQINGFDKGLFAFEATLGNAKAVEHGWITEADRERDAERYGERLRETLQGAAARITGAVGHQQKPVAWMSPEHIEAYRSGKPGTAWVSPDENEFYSVPLYGAPLHPGSVGGARHD